MFGFFERLVDPFPKQLAQRPPRGVYQFCRHYTQGMRRGAWSLNSETVSTVLPASEPWEQSPSRFWAPVSRDISAERTILSLIELQLHGE